MVRWGIWYHLHNLKDLKNTHGGVLFLVKLQTSTAKLPSFKNFQNTVRAGRVSKTKLTLSNVFVVDGFALGGEKGLKYD